MRNRTDVGKVSEIMKAIEHNKHITNEQTDFNVFSLLNLLIQVFSKALLKLTNNTCLTS